MADLHAWWTPYITAQARARGLDPQAVLAVAHMEGLSGGVGDGGHAFGPFQLNDAGGVLTGRPGNHRAFAEGKAGINFALDSMARYAKGLTGQAAIHSIVTNFERPANPGREIAGATRMYQGGATGGGTIPQAPTDPSTPTGIVGPTAAETAASGAAQIKAQAQSGFAKIASGEQTATESFGDTANFIKAMKANPPPPPPQLEPSVYQAAQGGDKLAAGAVKLVQRYLGVKYTWGGTNEKTGFDCSGLVQHVWAAMGVHIPRTTYAQWDAGHPVAQDALRPGDEVFFTGSDPMNGKPGHEGLYIGNGKFIEAPGHGMTVRVSDLAGRSDYVGARRFA